MGIPVSHIIVIFNESIHEVASIEPVAGPLLEHVEHITPHCFCGAVFHIYFPSRNFVSNEEKPRADMLHLFA